MIEYYLIKRNLLVSRLSSRETLKKLCAIEADSKHISEQPSHLLSKYWSTVPFAVKVSENKKTLGALNLHKELFFNGLERKNDEFLIIQLERRKGV